MRLGVLAVLLFPVTIGAQQFVSRDGAPVGSRATAREASATRILSAPALDGKDDDAVWKEAQVIDQFLEYEPNEGAETRFRTEVRIAYDEKYLYVLGRMFDPAPDSIISLLSRRDVRTNSEQLKLVIDSYHDRRTAYQFITNPAGVKRDFYVYNDNIEDASWDAVWDVATGIDSLGWVAEFRIPFSQLRFTDKDVHTFGFMAVRDVARTGARISWPLYRRATQGYVSQAGEVSGIQRIAKPRRLEIAPYLVTQNVTRASGGGFTHPQKSTIGADVKYGLSSNLTLDATVNPDFGQVEADPAVLNLSAFEQFFEERRPFFLEGSGIFTLNTNCGDIDSQCTGLFYSRRIGRSPQLSGAYGDASSPTATTILGAAKLTGRLPTGTSIGVLNAVAQEERGTEGRTIEPRSNYMVGRLQQDFRQGRTTIGLMATGVSRSLDEWTENTLRREAYTAGLDMRHRFFSNNYEVAAMLSGSTVRGSESAIAALQRDGVHRFQRPDDDLEYDPARTSLGGNAQRLSISKFGGGITRFQTVYQRFNAGFETNDVGFQTRADDQLFRNWFALQWNRPALFYRRLNWNFNASGNWSAEGLPTSTWVNSNAHAQLRNMMWLHGGVSYGNFGTTYDDRDARGGPAVRRAPNVDLWGGIEGDNRKTYTPYLFAGFNASDAGNSSSWYVNPSLNLRNSSRLSANIGVNFRKAINDNQWRANFGVAGSDTARYTFARLDQTTMSLSTRLNFTATPTLSLQIYAEPFVTTGTYSNWRELDDPRAKEYDDRYRPFTSQGDPGGFDFKQFRSNAVLRWEYRAGSTLFLVWQQGRTHNENSASDFSLRRDYRELFSLHPDNTLLLKVSYWLNP